MASLELHDRSDDGLLQLRATGDAELELWAATRHAAEFERVIGKPLRVEVSAAIATAPAAATETAKPEPAPEPAKPLSGADLVNSALALARLEAQIARQVDEYNKRPRKAFVGARAVESRFAQYVEDWRLKIERIGNLNYPDSARGRIYGSLRLTISIKPDGSVDDVQITRASTVLPAFV